MSDPFPAEPPPTPLDRVVDDVLERDTARQSIAAQLLAGRIPEELVAELVASGWSQDDAEEMVEDGRKQTRAQRGVVTRDDVARAVHQRYRTGMAAGWMAGIPMVATV